MLLWVIVDHGAFNDYEKRCIVLYIAIPLSLLPSRYRYYPYRIVSLLPIYTYLSIYLSREPEPWWGKALRHRYYYYCPLDLQINNVFIVTSFLARRWLCMAEGYQGVSWLPLISWMAVRGCLFRLSYNINVDINAGVRISREFIYN